MMDTGSNEYSQSDNISVSAIIDSLKNLNEANSVRYFSAMVDEYRFILKDGCDTSLIESLEKVLGAVLPVDYKQFLMLTDGLEFPWHVGSRIFDIAEVNLSRQIFDAYPKGFFVVGSCFDTTYHIMLNLKSDSCVYAYRLGDAYLCHLNISFTEFLNRFIMTCGSPFWTWGGVETDIQAIPC